MKIKKFERFVNEGTEVPPGYRFLGYHSSKRRIEGFDTTVYRDELFRRVRRVFNETVPTATEGFREALDDREEMLRIMDRLGIRVTFLSEEPIEGSNFQPERYKYGDELHKVYGKDYIAVLQDFDEIGASMVVYRESDPLYFKHLPG